MPLGGPAAERERGDLPDGSRPPPAPFFIRPHARVSGELHGVLERSLSGVLGELSLPGGVRAGERTRCGAAAEYWRSMMRVLHNKTAGTLLSCLSPHSRWHSVYTSSRPCPRSTSPKRPRVRRAPRQARVNSPRPGWRRRSAPVLVVAEQAVVE